MPTKETLPSSKMVVSLWWYIYDKYNSTNCYMGNGSLNNSRMFILDMILSVIYIISLTDKMGNDRVGPQCVEQMH